MSRGSRINQEVGCGEPQPGYPTNYPTNYNNAVHHLLPQPYLESKSYKRETLHTIEEKIRCALEKRGREGTSFQDPVTGFGVPRSTLAGLGVLFAGGGWLEV